MLVRVPCGDVFDSLTSSRDDMEERDVEEGDCLGVSFGEPAADDSYAVAALALLRVAIRGGIAEEAMVYMIVVDCGKNKLELQSRNLPCGGLPGKLY